FKGSWLSLWLTEMGAIVKGYALDAPKRPGGKVAVKVAFLP
ncbi:CDP-glucose 4,6-dehydratase, partial [Salmonella enterica subsp. enterica serovar Enteritidis]|nr:CDP-glucose 4,6-dehydratase [Salmonella enterica subsp. enterica serovar Enteritidis]